ncbi:MAG: hypothetical protein O3A95_02130 [Planctomycetota bacterium]|nr:hypothetical protein [Planctomycetota bacterium]MDA1113081.1 hypothetical protein [Planctomycetota bacterium]
MPQSDFFKESKYCSRCHDYVRYLQSLDASFCIDCGAKVRLFSAADKRTFQKKIKQAKEAQRDGKKWVG